MQPDIIPGNNAPIWLLIDTNLVRNLVSFTEYGFNLRQLEKWIAEGYVKLIVTPQSIVEWKKHRLEVMSRITAKLKEYRIIVRAHRGLQEHAPIAPDLSAADNLFQSQIDAIDKLLAVATTEEEYIPVLKKVYQLQLHGQPPFHINDKSYYDAYMFFNATHFIAESGIPAFYFISHNTKDFADQNDKKSLHPALKLHYPNVEVHYYIDFDSCFADLKAIGLPSIETPENVGTNAVTKYEIIRDASMLDQLHDYFQQVFKEWNFLPHRFFSDHYPFIKGHKASYYKRPFTIYTNNEEVVKLLTNVGQSGAKFFLKNPDQFPADDYAAGKLKYVMTVLAVNRVTYLTLDTTGINKFDIFRVAEISALNSPIGLLLRFEYGKLFNIKIETSDDGMQILEKAYVQAKMGQLLEAFNSYKAAAELAFTKGTSLYYLARFCMKKMGNIIRGNYPKEQLTVVTQAHQEAISINLEEALKHSSNVKNREILFALHNNEQLQRSGLIIHQAVSKLRDFYYGRSNGNSDQLLVLEFEFRQLEGFYVLNNNIFDEYGEFLTIAQDYIEGLFTAYGCSEDLSGRLEGFNDPLLFSIVRYAGRDFLENMFRRYDIRSIKLAKEYDGANFIGKFVELLRGFGNIMDAFEAQEPAKSYVFPDMIDGQIINFLILAARVAYKKELTDSVFDALDVFLTSHHPPRNNYFYRKHLAYFVEAKGQDASENKLLRLLFFCLESNEFDDAFLVITIVEKLSLHQRFSIKFTAEQFEKFKSRYLPDNPTPQNDNNFSIVERLHGVIANKAYRAEISQYFISQLSAKFNFRLFYGPAIFGIIPKNEGLIAQYHEQMYNYIAECKQTVLVGISRSSDLTIDSYLNYCFKEKVLLPATVIDNLKTLSPYYQWLLDMENFDYAKFHFRWLSAYYTRYYRARFRESKALKAFMLKFLKEQPKSPYQGTFINIFHM